MSGRGKGSKGFGKVNQKQKSIVDELKDEAEKIYENLPKERDVDEKFKRKVYDDILDMYGDVRRADDNVLDLEVLRMLNNGMEIVFGDQ